MTNPWKTVKKNYIYENKFGYKLRDDDVITPSGKPGKYMVLESTGYVTFVALTPDQQVILTRQWRYPIEAESLEIPAETLHANEGPLEGAKRGLMEEVGATSPNWVNLGWHWLGNGAMNIKGHVYLCTDLVFTSSHLDETEDIRVEKIPLPEALGMVRTNAFTDYRTKLGLLLAKQYLDSLQSRK